MNKHLSLLFATLLAAIFSFLPEFSGTLDLPNHLARAHLIGKCFSSAGCGAYDAQILPIPYILSDFLLLLLLNLFPVSLASKVAVFLSIMIPTTGWYVLYRTIHGRINSGFFAGVFLCFGAFVDKGFFAFLIGIGLFLFWIAGWVRYRKSRSTFSGIILFCSLFLLFLTHLSAIVFIGIFLGTFFIREIFHTNTEEKFPIKKYSMEIGILIFSGILYLAQQLFTGLSATSSAEIRGSSEKILALFYPIVTGQKYLDVLLFCTILLLVFPFKKHIFKIQGSRIWLLTAVFFTACYFIVPVEMHGVFDVDQRFLVPAFLFFFLWCGFFEKRDRLIFSLSILILTMSVGFHTKYRLQSDQELSQIDSIVKQIPADSSLVFINDLTRAPDSPESRMNPFSHYPAMYILYGGNIVHGIFDCYQNRNMAYFCPKDPDYSSQEHHLQFGGLQYLADKDLNQIQSHYKYILVRERNKKRFQEFQEKTPWLNIISSNPPYALLENHRKRIK